MTSVHALSNESDEEVPTDTQKDLEKTIDVLQKAGKVTVNNNVAHTKLTRYKSNKDKPTNDSSGEGTLSKASSTGDDNDELDNDDDGPFTTVLDADETGMQYFTEKRMNQYD